MGRLERGVNLPLLASLRVGDLGQVHDDRSIEEVTSGDDLRDPVEQERARRLEDHLVRIRVQLARRKAATRREPAECIGEPRGEVRDVVERDNPAIGGGDEQVSAITGFGS
jgi:hypothetical protein